VLNMRRDLLKLLTRFPDDKESNKLQFTDDRSKYMPIYTNGAICRPRIFIFIFIPNFLKVKLEGSAQLIP
jgi:hypothetical protein